MIAFVILGFVLLLAGFMCCVIPVLPLLTARRWGAGKVGICGSVIGMLAGMFLLPPFGAIIGTFLGAVVGELRFGKPDGEIRDPKVDDQPRPGVEENRPYQWYFCDEHDEPGLLQRRPRHRVKAERQKPWKFRGRFG